MAAQLTDLFYQALTVLFLVGLPITIVVAVVGILAGALQAATSIKDLSSFYAVKLIAVLFLVYLMGGAFITQITKFAMLAWQ